MSKKTNLRDGCNIYDTPKYPTSNNPKKYPGYNGLVCGGQEVYPTHGIGSAWEKTAYWERKLFNRVLSVLDFKMPDTWDKNYFLWILFRVGFVGIIDAKARVPGKPGYGKIPQYCTFGGRNIYYQPTYILVSNPLIKSEKYDLGKNAALLKLSPDYQGCWDLIHYHAEKLAILDQALDMAGLNSRLAKAFLADNQAMAQALYTIFDCIDQGDPLIGLSKNQIKTTEKGNLPYMEINQDVGKNYIVDKLQAAIETQLDQFDREIGIPVMNDKKERQISGEIKLTEKKALTAIDVWVDTLTDSAKELKKVFPDIEFSVSRPDLERGSVNEPVNKVESGKTEPDKP